MDHISAACECNHLSSKRPQKQNPRSHRTKRVSKSSRTSSEEYGLNEEVSESNTPTGMPDYLQKMQHQHSKAVGHLVAMQQRCERLANENAKLKEQIQYLLQLHGLKRAQAQGELMPDTPDHVETAH